jgi:acetate kinase
MKVLLLNAGSSSLKASLVKSSDGTTIARASADWAGDRTRYRFTTTDAKSADQGMPADSESSHGPNWKSHGDAVRRFLQDLKNAQPSPMLDDGSLAAVGHRIVHGGDFNQSVQITPEVRARITALARLAPLHNPPSLETISAAEAELPTVPQIAVFDTAFHSTLSVAARTYPVPQKWTHQWGIRRYGFHGLSHEYCARRAAEMLAPSIDSPRLVICHLGHGCSASAVHDGRCVDTTMGFTPLDGLMMATRCGSIDPSIIIHMQQNHDMSLDEINLALTRESGLLGVSGISADMREVLAAARSEHEQSSLAIEIYTRRVRQSIGSLAVTMGGIDALIFTAGVGENSPEIRAMICNGLECLGIDIDPAANDACRPDADVSKPESPCRILIIATREDVTMLHQVEQVLMAS